MWLKNLIVFRSDTPLQWSQAELDELLSRNLCPECGPHSLSTQGFVSPVASAEQMAYDIDGLLACMHQKTERVLPAAVIAEEVGKRVAKIKHQEGRIIDRKEQSEIKEQVVFDLLPRAFTRSKRMPIIIDTRHDRVMVDSATTKKAEEALEALRHAVGSLPVTPLDPGIDPKTVLTQWLRDPSGVPDEFELGDRGELQSVNEARSKVQYTAIDLDREEVLAHINAGMSATRVNLYWKENIEFDLTADLVFKRIRALDIVQQTLSDAGDAEAADELRTEVALQGGELRNVLDRMLGHFEAA